MEAAELYGEYAIDFAVQAVSQAMLAALSALVLQADRRDVLEEGGEQE